MFQIEHATIALSNGYRRRAAANRSGNASESLSFGNIARPSLPRAIT